MSEDPDKYEHYNYDHDKHMYSGHSGKQRTKKEAEQHTNQHDVGGIINIVLRHAISFTIMSPLHALIQLIRLCLLAVFFYIIVAMSLKCS